jgi:hypothetical protein
MELQNRFFQNQSSVVFLAGAAASRRQVGAAL